MSDKISYENGETVHLDGGMSLVYIGRKTDGVVGVAYLFRGGEQVSCVKNMHFDEAYKKLRESASPL